MRTREVEELFIEPPRRTGARRILLAILAFCAVATITAVAIVARNRSDPLAQLRIRDEGVAVVHGTTPERAGIEGQDLDEGDVVRTDADGQAQIDLFDGSLVRLDQDSEVSLRTLKESDDGREISLGLLRGRMWSRVAEQRDGDRYTVGLGEAEVTAVGTTFLTDCTATPTCHVLGVEGTAVVESSVSKEVQVEENDCVEVDRDGRLTRCDPDDLIDAWVRENLAEDEQLISTQTPSPTPSPTATAPSRRRAPAPAPAAPASTPAPTATPTDGPDTPEPTIPRRTKKPPSPKPTPDETPFDGGIPQPSPTVPP